MALSKFWDRVEGVTEAVHIDGVFVASAKELGAILKVSSKTISNYEKKGMEKHKNSVYRFPIYDVEYCRNWINENISKTYSKNGSKNGKSKEQEEQINISISSDETNSDYESMTVPQKRSYLRELDKNSLDEKNVAEQIIERENKNKENDKKWVRVDKPKKTVEALARSFTSLLKNMMIVVSSDCENMSQDGIYHFMDRYLSKEMNKLKKLSSDDFEIDLYEIQEEILILKDIGINEKNILEVLTKLKEEKQ